MENTVKNFPKSIFSQQTLMKVAGRFKTIPDLYGDPNDKYKFNALSYDELKNIWRAEEHPITEDEMSRVVGVYDEMTSFDAYFLATRLPLKTLASITGLPQHAAAALKRACNYLRDMPYEEYRKRDTSKPIFFNGEKPPVNIPYEFADDKSAILRKLKPYMNLKSYKRMPTTARLLARATPRHVLKWIWVGKGFDKCYAEIMK